MSLAPGARVADRYTVVRPIGRGGLATVWLVRHDALQTLHALKVLTVGSDALYARMVAEGRIQAGLQHPNVLPVTDLVRVAGAVGLILQYVPGPSLRTLLADGPPLGLDEAHAVFRGIAAGVAAAHRAGVVHRDLKPANVLLQVEDGRVVPKVTDFGLAKALATGLSGGDQHATRSGAMLGTPAYMAPEQVKDASKVDPRADVFALGAVAYELVTGLRAFEGDDVVETLGRVKAVRYTPVRACRADLPDGVVEAIEGALVADPGARLPTVDAMLALWCREGRPEPGAAFAARVAGLGAGADEPGTPSPTWPLQDSGPSASTYASSAPPTETVAGPPAVRGGLPWWGQLGAGAALFAAGIAVTFWWTSPAPAPAPAPLPAPEPLQIPEIPEIPEVPDPQPPPKPVRPPPVEPAPAPPAAVPPGMLSPAAAKVAQELGSLVTDLSADAMAGREDLVWLRDTLPGRLDEIVARAEALAAEHAGTDAELQAWYHAGHALWNAHGYYRWARAPLNSEGEERAAWERAVAETFGPEAARTQERARVVFERVADRGHPAASGSALPAIARQMLAVMARDSKP